MLPPPETIIVGGDVKPVPPAVIVYPVIIVLPPFICAPIVMNPPPLKDITGAAVYPRPLLVIVMVVIAPAATADVVVDPVPVPFIKTFGAVVHPLPPVLTATEFITDVADDNDDVTTGKFVLVEL